MRTFGLVLLRIGLVHGLSARCALFTSDVCLKHEPGWFNIERPERLLTLRTALEQWTASAMLGESLQVMEPARDATKAELARVHTARHLNLIDDAYERVGKSIFTPRINLDGDTVVSPGTQEAATRAAGLALAAVDLVFSSDEDATTPKRAFVMARPPGHHAEPDRPMGFCLYNNIVVAAKHAQAVHGVERIAILDFDVHHGNGCAAACWSDPTMLYASTHQAGIFPMGLSAFTPEMAGRAGADGQILSSLLPAGAGSSEFRDAWARQLLPAVEQHNPGAIFLSAGFDGHASDDVASIGLQDDDYEWITSEVVQLSDRLGGVPIVSVMEGGYELNVLERCCRIHVEALANK